MFEQEQKEQGKEIEDRTKEKDIFEVGQYSNYSEKEEIWKVKNA